MEIVDATEARLYQEAQAGTYTELFEREVSELMDSEQEFLIEQEMEIEDVLSDSLFVRHSKDHVDVIPSEFTEFAIKLAVAGGIEDFNFEDRQYLKPIYDTASRRLLLKCGRQVEKSTMLGNICLTYASLNPAFKTIYVSATAQQATVFSVDRIREVIETSPIIAGLTNSKLAQNVFFKQFNNRSQIRMRYAFLSADRVRGIPADLVLIDEIQDILTQNIPIIEECASHSRWKLFRYSGTPKSMDNTIQVYWDQFSTQNEWVVPCDKCNNWNILGERNIGKKGLICAKCGGPINVNHPDAQWASQQPVTPSNEDRVAFEGYRIPQIMVPWIVNDEEAWKGILLKQSQYDRPSFYNEVLGLSYDSGVRPLTRKDVEDVCQEHIHMSDLEKNVEKCNGHVFAGIDYGTGENASFTVLALGGYMDKGFQIFFVHRFTGRELEPPIQMDMIARLLTKVNFSLAGTDYGGGFDRNHFLVQNFGPQKIWKYQYAARPNQKVVWQPKLGRFVVHRTEIMSDIFNAVKDKKILLPNWDEFRDPYAADLLNIFSEVNQQLRMVQYKVSPGKSDDTFHAILYCFLASMLVRRRPDVIVPMKEGDVDIPM